MASINYFAHQTAAQRYAQARPNIHPTVVEKFRSFASVDGPFQRALDVGCGTGQSTLAVAGIACSVVGIDTSADMLGQALGAPNVAYRQAQAENTPFPDAEFDLITVGLAFHWFDQDAFLVEASRVLKSGGWLVIYNSWFTGEMKENTAFKHWTTDKYLNRYPIPPRNRAAISDEFVRLHGFSLFGEDDFSNEVAMTVEKLVNYLVTQTNIIVAVEQGTERIEDVAGWINTSITDLFGNAETRTFCFGGKLWYLRKENAT